MNWSITHNPAYWGEKRLNYPNVPKEHAKFSESVVVENLVFVSGCIGKDAQTSKTIPKNIADQTYFALENTRLALNRAGSSMENIVKTFSLIRDLSEYGEYRKAETEYYEKYGGSIHRSVYELGEKATNAFENSRNNIAKFIGASKNSIILVLTDHA